MSGPTKPSAENPYADLSAAVSQRKQEYLTALVRDFDPKDPVQQLLVVAKRRGYLRGNHHGHEGKRPTSATDDEKAWATNKVHDNLLSLWYDNPASRLGPPDDYGDSDVNHVIAWLSIEPPDPKAPSKLKLPGYCTFETPPLAVPLPARRVLDFCTKLGAPVYPQLEQILKDAKEFENKDDEQKTLRERIMTSIQSGQAPETPADASTLKEYLRGIGRLLPQDLVDQIVNRAKEYWDLRGDNAIIATGGSGPPEAPESFRHAVEMLAMLGNLSTTRLGDAFVNIADYVLPDWVPDRASKMKEIEESPYAFAFVFTRPRLGIPLGTEWPEWSNEAIYWWSTIILRHCIQKLLSTDEMADFHATDILRFSFLFKDDGRVPPYVRDWIQFALVHFKYSFYEPAKRKYGDLGDDGKKNEEMTSWSENHQIAFAQAEYLAGQLFEHHEFPEGATYENERVTGKTHIERAGPRVLRWLNNRLRFGFSEWNSPGYYNEDFPPLFNLADFCADPTIKAKAALVLDLLIFDLARFTCRGSFGVTAGRAYWEHKAYGWEQSVGETIEILFGTRGDFVEAENTAVALCTTRYEIPEVLLAIGKDRVVLDRGRPFVDRSRISITFDEAKDYGIGFDKDEDILFWWGNMAYFDHTLEGTRRLVEAHDNLKSTPPFNLLFTLDDSEGMQIFYDFVQEAAGLLVTEGASALAVLLPFPLSLIAASLALGGIETMLEGWWHLFKDIGTLIAKGIHKIGEWLGLGGEDNEPKIPRSALRKFLEDLLVEFNRGNVLQRANMYTYCNGDAMLSSVQNYMPGLLSFQKHPWEATLDCDACVWTSAPFTDTDWSSVARGWLEFYKDLAQFRPVRAFADIGLSDGIPFVDLNNTVADELGHDGPSYWTGSVALPMIVQHENAAIIAYNTPNLQRAVSGACTHAWFPKDQFDETEQLDRTSDGETWTFGRKGDGYVGLLSARKVRRTQDAHNPWSNKELRAEGGGNIWVCLVGNAATFGNFATFKREALLARVNISGVGTWNALECSFDIPRASAPAGRAPRLELHYSDRKGQFAGEDLTLDEFPRFDNDYVRTNPGGVVAWGATGYEIRHPDPKVGLFLRHTLAGPDSPSPDLRNYNRQPNPLSTQKALANGVRRQFQQKPQTIPNQRDRKSRFELKRRI